MARSEASGDDDCGDYADVRRPNEARTCDCGLLEPKKPHAAAAADAVAADVAAAAEASNKDADACL